jgi:hypothetical protein
MKNPKPSKSTLRTESEAWATVYRYLNGRNGPHFVLSIPDPAHSFERTIAANPVRYGSVVSYPWGPTDKRALARLLSSIEAGPRMNGPCRLASSRRELMKQRTSFIWLNWQTAWSKAKERFVADLVSKFKPARWETMLFITYGFGHKPRVEKVRAELPHKSDDEGGPIVTSRLGRIVLKRANLRGLVASLRTCLVYQDNSSPRRQKIFVLMGFSLEGAMSVGP